MHFFLQSPPSSHDDLLFFVRALPSSPSSPLLSDNFPDSPIFVRRRIENKLPSLSDVVCWKQTLFLNLICQTSATLTVSICKKDKKEIDLSSERVKKSSMKCLRRVMKHVYPAPYKSRLDSKCITTECTYPHIYYSINDFESESLHLDIAESEYLCVELSVIFDPSSPTTSYVTENIPVDIDDSPFPTPPNKEKIVLFKGAVSYNALLDVYAQKSTLRKKEDEGEYILMRGPEGKGQVRFITII